MAIVDRNEAIVRTFVDIASKPTVLYGQHLVWQARVVSMAPSRRH